MLKSVLIFSCGVAVGATAMFFSLRERYQKEINDEAEELRAYYYERFERKGKGLEKNEKEESEESKEKESDISKVKEYTNSDKYEEMEEAYERLREKEHPEEDKDYYEGAARSEEITKNSKPKIIKKDSFDDYPHHDKQTLFYYTEDDTLATEEDQIVDDIESLVGDALTKYGFKDNTDDFVYVRNCGIGTDFVIEKVYGSFSKMFY